MSNSLLVTRIGSLVTNDPDIGVGPLGIITDAALVIENETVAWIGPTGQSPAADNVIDAAGAAVLPGFVDSHAHLVFAGERGDEFAARMQGQAYEAGGIRRTVNATRAATDDDLRQILNHLAAELLHSGCTTFETKSGYGLTVTDESRALQLATEATPETTYLGAHVVPAEFANDPGGYVDLVTGEMLSACAPHSKWIDVFCDRGAFDADQARAILTAGIAAGLQPRIHANQLQHGQGVQLAVELDCASADHCTHLDAADIAALADSNTVATLLPGAEFSTRATYPNARTLIDAGATVALATDCNPGSSFTTSMSFCIAVAVRDMFMSPDEAVWSATQGGAHALRRDDVGHLSVGARGDLLVLDAPSHVHLSYRPGVDLIRQVIVGGSAVRAPQSIERPPL